MGGCFGSHPIDRWLESQVDAYCGGNEFRRERRAKCIMRDSVYRVYYITKDAPDIKQSVSVDTLQKAQSVVAWHKQRGHIIWVSDPAEEIQ